MCINILVLLYVFHFGVVRILAESWKPISVAGIFTPFTASNERDGESIQCISAFIMAIHEINSRKDILPNHILKFTIRSPIGFIDTVETALDIQKHSFNGSNVEAFVTGLPYPTTSALNDVINERLHKLYITSTTGAVGLSHSEVGKYKVRTVPADSFNGMVLQDAIGNVFGHKKVSIFYSYDETSLRTSMEIGDGVYGEMSQLSSHAFQTKTEDFTDHINAAKAAGSQVFVILTGGEDGAMLLEQGYNQGLFKEGTQIFGSALLTADQPWKYMSKHANVPAIMKGYIGVIFDPSFHLHDLQEGKDFVAKFRSQKATMTVNSDGTETCDESKDDDGHYLYREQTHNGSGRVRCAGMDFSSLKADGSDIAPYAPHAYDAVYLLAYGLHNLLEVQGQTDIDGGRLRRAIIDNVTFTGTTGFVDIYEGMSEFDDYGSGDRESGHAYRLYNFNEEVFIQTSGMNGYVDIGHWTPEGSVHLCDASIETCSPITYRTKDNQRAKDSPDDIIILMPDAMRVALYVIGSLIAILVIAVTIGVWKYRQSKIIKVSQPAMLYVILAGAMIGAGRVIAGGIPLSDGACMAEIWFIHMSFVLVCGSLFVKSWRVNALLNSTKIRRVKITIIDVLSKVAIAAAVMALYLMFITVFGGIRVVLTSTLAHNQITIRSHCTYKHAEMEMALYAIEGVILGLGARLCWALKTLPSSFNESKHIASAITCLVSITALVIPLAYLLNLEPHISRFIIAMAFGVWITFTVVTIFGDKFYLAATGKDNDDDDNNANNNYNASSNHNNNRSRVAESSNATYETGRRRSSSFLNGNIINNFRDSISWNFRGSLFHTIHGSGSGSAAATTAIQSVAEGNNNHNNCTGTGTVSPLTTQTTSHTRGSGGGGGSDSGHGSNGGGGGGQPLLRGRSSIKTVVHRQYSVTTLKGISEIEDGGGPQLPTNNNNNNNGFGCVSKSAKKSHTHTTESTGNINMNFNRQTSSLREKSPSLNMQKTAVEELLRQNSNKIKKPKESLIISTSSRSPVSMEITKGLLTHDESTLLSMNECTRREFISTQIMLWERSLNNLQEEKKE